jgi:hypothetical protein
MAGTLKLVEQKLMTDEEKKHIKASTRVLIANSTQHAAVEDYPGIVCNLEVVGM